LEDPEAISSVSSSNIVNDDIQGEIRDRILEIADHYEVWLLELHDISKQNGHPD